MKATFGARLKELRKRSGLSAEKLAALLGVHRNSVIGYENDVVSPSVHVLSGLRAANLDWIFAVTGQAKEEVLCNEIDWKLVESIWGIIEEQNAIRRKKLTTAQKFAALRNVYTIAAKGHGDIPAVVANAFRIAA